MLWRELLCASTPAVAWTLVGCPFNVITVRLQTTSHAQFRGAWHCLSATVAQEGVLALWKGFVPSALGSIPYSTCLFGSFAYLRPPRLPAAGQDRMQPASTVRKHLAQVFSAGFASGIVLTLLQNPFDVWRTRLQTQSAASGGVLRSLWSKPILATRGLPMMAVRQMPGNGFFFATHEYLTMCAEMLPNHAEHPSLTRFCVGGLTGTLFSLVFFPFDVAKARLMLTSPAHGGSIQMARELLHEAGWRGFYRGVGVVLLRSFPTNAMGFLTLQISQDALAVNDP